MSKALRSWLIEVPTGLLLGLAAHDLGLQGVWLFAACTAISVVYELGLDPSGWCALDATQRLLGYVLVAAVR